MKTSLDLNVDRVVYSEQGKTITFARVEGPYMTEVVDDVVESLKDEIVATNGEKYAILYEVGSDNTLRPKGTYKVSKPGEVLVMPSSMKVPVVPNGKDEGGETTVIGVHMIWAVIELEVDNEDIDLVAFHRVSLKEQA